MVVVIRNQWTIWTPDKLSHWRFRDFPESSMMTSVHKKPMAIWSPCSDLTTRQIKWISRSDQLNNGSRPGSYIAWGISCVSIAAQYSETYADEVK